MISSNHFRVDRSHMYDLLRQMPQQIDEAVELRPELSLPDINLSLQHVLITGMGGSAIAGDLLAGLYGDTLDLPLIVNRDYRLPQFVGSHSLVIACSYSGNTEETLAAVEQAAVAGAPIVCIASGGKLAKFALKNGCGLMRIPDGLPPRCALGYLFFSLMTVMQEYGILSAESAALDETRETVKKLTARYADVQDGSNEAAALAEKLLGKVPIIYGADEPNPALPLRWRNQLNENAKVHAFSNLLPEMNHNEIVPWLTEGGDNFHVVMLFDDHNPPELQRRMQFTRDLIAEKTPVTIVRPTGETRLCRTFSLLVLADFVSYYLALLKGVDPTEIRAVDRLKAFMDGHKEK